MFCTTEPTGGLGGTAIIAEVLSSPELTSPIITPIIAMIATTETRPPKTNRLGKPPARSPSGLDLAIGGIGGGVGPGGGSPTEPGVPDRLKLSTDPALERAVAME